MMRPFVFALALCAGFSSLAVGAVEPVNQDEEAPLSRALSVMRGNPGVGNSLIFEKDCVTCHGLNGRGTRDDRPNLGGQKKNYLIKQIEDFQKGRDVAWRVGREDRDMSGHAKGLTSQQIVDIATFYASLDCRGTIKTRYAKVEKPQIATRCEVCHGTEGRAPGEEMMPRLAGQNATYIANQITSFQRHAGGQLVAKGLRYRGHPMMDTQARSVTSGEGALLAQYFSSRRCR